MKTPGVFYFRGLLFLIYRLIYRLIIADKLLIIKRICQDVDISSFLFLSVIHLEDKLLFDSKSIHLCRFSISHHVCDSKTILSRFQICRTDNDRVLSIFSPYPRQRGRAMQPICIDKNKYKKKSKTSGFAHIFFLTTCIFI